MFLVSGVGKLLSSPAPGHYAAAIPEALSAWEPWLVTAFSIGEVVLGLILLRWKQLRSVAAVAVIGSTPNHPAAYAR